MQLEQSFDLPVPREAAWSAFQDVRMLISCLPGAALAGAPDADPLQLAFSVKLGPIAANFAGQGRLTYGPDYKGSLSGNGADRGTGSRVKGSAAFELHEAGGSTRVRLAIDYALTGSLAQFARTGIVKELAAGITRQFAANLQAKLTADAGPATGGNGAPAKLDAGALLWSALKERVRGGRESASAAVDRPSGLGLAALLAARPQWTRLERAAQLIDLQGRWLLHAGPPLSDPLAPPAPVLSSAVLACMQEGWADTEEEAERLVKSGEVRLQPAQDHRCVTPLAAIVSPATTMIVVEDVNGAVPAAYAPLGTVGGPDARFGTRDPAVLERLRLRDREHAPALAAALDGPLDLLSIAAEAVAAGDDLHNRCVAATQALAARLGERYRARAMEADEAVKRLMSGLAGTPTFFLTFWMAAAKLALLAAEGGEPHTLVTRMGGNGEAFGISLAARPDAWIAMPAGAPCGSYMPGVPPASEALGAIGDSAVIDALGFGGQALDFAPEVKATLQPFIPAGSGTVARRLLAEHPAFGQAGLRVGLDAARVVADGVAPLITLGMVEKTGRGGLLGRGVYVPEMELFARAVRALADEG